MVEVPPQRCWQWLFHGEAASLRFPAGYDAVPKENCPIVLGRIRFPKNGGMTLQTNSIPRAIEGARFFGPRLGPKVIAMRCRVVNRCFSADEGKPDELTETLDHDVTVIEPREAEAAFRREFEGVRTLQDAERAAAEFLERRLRSKEDVPLVEDFPLAPGEETPEFRDLTTSLQLRLVRAVEHWRGQHAPDADRDHHADQRGERAGSRPPSKIVAGWGTPMLEETIQESQFHPNSEAGGVSSKLRSG